jgi:hypothetical protein
VKWHWHTLHWGTLHCTVYRQMYCVTGWVTTVLCILLHHITSGLEGMVSDILTLDFCEASLSSTVKLYFNTLHLWYWWIVQCLKQQLMCMFICKFTNLITHTCEQNKLTLWRSYLNPYCLDRKTAFFSVGI